MQNFLHAVLLSMDTEFKIYLSRCSYILLTIAFQAMRYFLFEYHLQVVLLLLYYKESNSNWYASFIKLLSCFKYF